jgi:peptide methionine sulfoxide reductase MsrB
MSVANANNFRKKNKEYNVYHCNISKANLFRSGDDDKASCNECTYLVNEHKKTIEISELDKYDVIFIFHDAEMV